MSDPETASDVRLSKNLASEPGPADAPLLKKQSAPRKKATAKRGARSKEVSPPSESHFFIANSTEAHLPLDAVESPSPTSPPAPLSLETESPIPVRKVAETARPLTPPKSHARKTARSKKEESTVKLSELPLDYTDPPQSLAVSSKENEEKEGLRNETNEIDSASAESATDASPGPDAKSYPSQRRNRRRSNRREQRSTQATDPENDRTELSDEQVPPSDADSVGESSEGGSAPRTFKSRKQRFLERKEKEKLREMAALEAAPSVDAEGIVEISSKGFGFLRERVRSFQQSPTDVFITPELVRSFGLRDGHMVHGIAKHGLRGPQLMEILSINSNPPEECATLPYFDELTAINPTKKLTLETDTSRFTTRVIDLVAPIGRGQRGLIVAPPRTGKTTLLHHIAEGLQKNYEEEVHLMVLLVDERPEEVTDFEHSFPNVEIFASSNDSEAKEHSRIALLAIERAKRLVESGRHVVMLMDSITRLARAFNSLMRSGGNRGTASGGLVVGALEVPRRIFAAARNTREAGSLTIIATALIQTNSKADEAIFQEFKGTGNMELVLDRQLSQNYIYPAVDINKSGTRREELLLPLHVLEKIYVIRRGLSGRRAVDAMEWLLSIMERYPSNAQMLMDIKITALT